MPDTYPKKITTVTGHSFVVEQEGWNLITMTARCQSAKQNDIKNGEDLRVEIDGMQLREVPPLDKPQYFDIPPAWNGTKLKGLSKTVALLLHLKKGEHKLVFVPRHGATIEREPVVTRVHNQQQLTLEINEQAEDGDRRTWYTFALIDLPLRSITADITVKWRIGDSDDVKLIIDDVVKKNSLSILHRDWMWSGNIFKKLLGRERREKTFKESLEKSTHYIEFWADKTPTLHRVILDIGESEVERAPTVDDPRWTGDFKDDTDQMMLARAIFGEARDIRLSDQARIGVGWSIRNRVEDSRWPNTYQEVITQPLQYSAFNEGDPNRQYVENPFFDNSQSNREAWYRCYEIAGQVIVGKVDDPTHGANHYYDDSINTPYWASDKTFVIKIDTIIFHKL
ncbi:MAG: cell wall hydrolase [Patescibacteria group bacterium]